MSLASPETQYSGYTFPFETPIEAGLVERNTLLKTPLATTLEENGIARVTTGLSSSDFGVIAEAFQACIEGCPEALKATSHTVDKRYGNEAGYVRKNRKINPENGLQEQDPKHYFHFNEQARLRWQQQFSLAPVELRRFLEVGYEIHDTLLRVARVAIIGALEPTHPRITQAYFPANSESVSFYRHVDYDDYPVEEATLGLPVAKPRLDIGGYTLQAHASSPGFWGETPAGKQHFDEHDGIGYAFAGATHRKIYGRSSFIKPLRHGVDRIIPQGLSHVPRRQADILFLDPWKIDAGVTPTDTEAY